jgi:deoxyribodipyrimidine photo-lyase
MTMQTSLIWFRHDLRLHDNSALLEAVRRGGAVVPVFVWSPQEEDRWPPGSASRWWLHHSLSSLCQQLRSLRSNLIIRRGDSLAELQRLGEECGADAVFWNRRYEPAAVQRDTAIKSALRQRGWTAQSFNAQLLFEPTQLRTRGGQPFQVFTPFWKACLAQPEPSEPEPTPGRLPAPSRWPHSESLENLQLLPKVDWAAGMRAAWQPGIDGAERRLQTFLDSSLESYPVDRDRPDLYGVSALSPHLHFGEISPRRVWHEVKKRAAPTARATLARAADSYLRELGWREFAHHLLYHFPHTTDTPLRPEFAAFPWQDRPGEIKAWQRGRTGYPLVDAGMRQLWTTGWMHNRVRMVVASFLVKDLLIPWQSGARWFWDTLVDADLANNTLGWQWSAGCGADAAPFFRVFNPVTQGERFDPAGDYVRRWVPELAKLPAPWIHRPWTASPSILADAGVHLGKTYPLPLVDHAEARQRALAAFAELKDRVR